MISNRRYYAGIGARNIPARSTVEIQSLAKMLSAQHYVLRSGAAMGADQAFEEAASSECGMKEIFLPWKGFNGHDSGTEWNEKKCISIAQIFHTDWDQLPKKVQLSCARNVAQILGPEPGISTPTQFVLCWAKDSVILGGKIVDCSGGTGHAVRIAAKNNIPVFNIIEKWSHKKFSEYIEIMA